MHRAGGAEQAGVGGRAVILEQLCPVMCPCQLCAAARAAPQTVLRAAPLHASPTCASIQLPRSNRPDCQAESEGLWPGGEGSSRPAIAARGSSFSPA